MHRAGLHLTGLLKEQHSSWPAQHPTASTLWHQPHSHYRMPPVGVPQAQGAPGPPEQLQTPKDSPSAPQAAALPMSPYLLLLFPDH